MKKILIIFLILAIIISGVVIYLNKVILPVKARNMVIQSLEEATGKRVALKSLQFSIFKGLVLSNLVISDNQEEWLNIKEASCGFLILPLLQKKIAVSSLRFNSAQIFLQRRKDNTFNLEDLLPKTDEFSAPKKSKFAILVYKVSIVNSKINFQDDTLPHPFHKTIDNINLDLHLSLPTSVKFNLKANIPGDTRIGIRARGEFKVSTQELNANIAIADLSPGEFTPYYAYPGLSIPSGKLDAQIKLQLKNSILQLAVQAQGKGLNISKDKILFELNGNARADIIYNLQDKLTTFAGKAAISKSQITGVETIGAINNIAADMIFDNRGVTCEKFNASVFGIPFEAKINLVDFNNPFLTVNANSGFHLSILQNILKERLKFNFPGSIQGDARLSLNIISQLNSQAGPQLSGYLETTDSVVKIEKIKSPFENIRGRVNFTQNQLKWEKLNLMYSGVDYETSGQITDFKAPGIQLKLVSSDLAFDSLFAVNDKLITISQLSGRYLNSKFAISGNINTRDPKNPATDINGTLNLDIEDLKKPLERTRAFLESSKLKGTAGIKFNLKGNPTDFKACAIQAQASSRDLSIYGLRPQELALDYYQEAGLIDIPRIRLAIYDGVAEGSAKLNLNSPNLPFWLAAEVKGVKIEKLKNDTPAKAHNLSGNLNGQIKINAFANDISRLNGSGRILIVDGRLWELDLFKGMGSLIFVQDFSSIIFSEASCSFIIQDKYILTNDLIMKSSMVNIDGAGKIGFDNSIDASLNVNINDDMVPLTGTAKDIATVILGQAGRFGVIKITGTLKSPKYKFNPAVTDIIKGIKDIFLKGSF